MHLAELQEAKTKMETWNLSKVTDRFARDQHLDLQEARRYENEFRRMMLLRMALKRRYGMNGKTDDYWHTFILYTEDYQRFCDRVVGRFVHHRPAVHDEVKTAEQSLAYIRFLIDYFRFYKEQPPTDIWPFSHELFGDVSEWQLEANCVGPCFHNCEPL